jgi:ParB-like chromosome segregation protein Spo0J
MSLTKIQLAALRLDFQTPDCLKESTVLEYAALLDETGVLPPVHVMFDGTTYFLADGFHRLEAAKRAGLKEIDAEILPGNLEEMEDNFQKYLRALKASIQSGIASSQDGGNGKG